MKRFLLGAEREGAFNIPFKVERGVPMKIVKVEQDISTVGEMTQLWQRQLLSTSCTNMPLEVSRDRSHT